MDKVASQSAGPQFNVTSCHVKTNSGPIASSWTGRHSRPMSRQPTPLRCQEADGQRTGHHAKSVQTKESSAVGLSEGKNDWSPVHVKHRHRGRNRAVPVSLLGRPRRQRADVQTPNGAALLDLARQYLRLLLQILPESFWQKGKKKNKLPLLLPPPPPPRHPQQA